MTLQTNNQKSVNTTYIDSWLANLATYFEGEQPRVHYIGVSTNCHGNACMHGKPYDNFVIGSIKIAKTYF